jgi:2-keto-3-deoxy-L-fuconate dehydrogenase
VSQATASKRALVTGAGQGIGRATAMKLAARGLDVLATSRTAAKLDDLPDIHRNVQIAGLDVTDRDAVFDCVARHGPFDVLCSCSGWVHEGNVLDCSLEDWQSSFEQNATSAFNLIQAVLPGMVREESGSIVCISSAASSVQGFAERSAYGASKAALIGLVKSVSRDFVATGIRCNAVCPGPVDSPSMRERLEGRGNIEEVRSRYIAAIPMGRFGTADEVADATVFLALDATYATGQIVILAGGL